MEDVKLNVEYVDPAELKPYPGNAKTHPKEQIEQIKESIRQVGFRDPIGLWHGYIVEGHGRQIAAVELGLEKVPVIRLDDMTDEQRRFYALVHNQTTMNSGWDFDILEQELAALEMDMSMFDFGVEEPEELFGYMRDDTFVDHNTEPETFDFTLQIQNEYRGAFAEYTKHHGKEGLVNLIVTEVLSDA